MPDIDTSPGLLFVLGALFPLVGFVLIVLGSVLATRRAAPPTSVPLTEQPARLLRSSR